MLDWKKRLFCAALLLAATGAVPALAQSANPVTPLPQRTTLHIAVGGTNIYTPFILYGQEKGYYDHANLDLQIFKVQGAAVTIAPMLAKGDLDIAPQTPSPSLFNLVSQGFGAKAIATGSGTKGGRVQDTWLMVSSDKTDQIKGLKDLKGKTIEAEVVGSGADFLVREALKKVSLDPDKDVKLLYRNRSAADFLTLAKSRSQDVIGMTEPAASVAEQQGYGKRWKSLYDIAPNAQDLILVASQKALDTNMAAVSKFMEVYIQVAREISASNGKWPPDLLRITAQFTGLQPDFVEFMGGAPYEDPNAELSSAALDEAQNLWVEEKLIKQKLDLKDVIDPRPVQNALKEIGRK